MDLKFFTAVMTVMKLSEVQFTHGSETFHLCHVVPQPRQNFLIALKRNLLRLVHFPSANNTMTIYSYTFPLFVFYTNFRYLSAQNKTWPTKQPGDNQLITNGKYTNRTLTIGNHRDENVSNTSSIERWRPRNSSWRSMIGCAESRKHSPK